MESVPNKNVANQTSNVAPVSATSGAGTARQSSAALEVLAQAQSLWNSGSHEAAIDLVREA